MLFQRQSHGLHLTTAHLAQTMTLLSLSALELRQKIDAALASNPALEMIEERRCPNCHRVLPPNAACPFCSRPQNLVTDEPIVFVSPREDFYNPKGSRSDETIDDPLEGYTSEEDLPGFVLRQIAPDLKLADRPLAASILTNLNEDGLLDVPLIELARYHHVPLSRLNEILALIQRAEPVGVASPTPEEALLVQLEVLSETRPVPVLARKLIQQGMDLLSHRQYGKLSRLLGVSVRQVQEIASFISDNLNPYPGRAHWGEPTATGLAQAGENRTYHFPDVIISMLEEREDSPLVVEVALPLAGTLRINPLFREALHHAPEEKLEQWKMDYEQACLLVKCIQQRNHTLVRLMQRLVSLQRQFILHGSANLLPVTRASLSKELGVHESTISRAVSAKAVQLPSGHIIPMDMFFDRSLHIRTALKGIIEQESTPLSDTEIGEQLAQQGYSIARRTVAKYRSMEGILPAHLRKPVGAGLPVPIESIS